MRTILFGAQAETLTGEIGKHPALELVDTAPDVIICYGGDGTLLSAELKWPGVPKTPIRNSRRGVRCIGHAPARVIERLAQGRLFRTAFTKLECVMRSPGANPVTGIPHAMNEFSVHSGRINSAVRFKLWINDEPYESGIEIIGDGFVVSTPFGSTAYFNQITRGVFHTGLGVAFKYTSEHTNHMVVPDTSVIRVEITRGPALIAVDNAQEYHEMNEHCGLVIRKSDQPAILYTWDAMTHPSHSY
ncbi:MAG: NAD(+)/NADH kinase [Candidatus Hydrogenedentes bacterium]|nr:NAD(+)/NADH kinase [Candidatus Hydrogenedentota bacterium]